MNKLKDEVRTMKVCDSVRYKDIYTAFVNNDEETRGLPRTELIEGPKRMLFKQFPGHNLKPNASRIYLSTPLYVPNDKSKRSLGTIRTPHIPQKYNSNQPKNMDLDLDKNSLSQINIVNNKRQLYDQVDEFIKMDTERARRINDL